MRITQLHCLVLFCSTALLVVGCGKETTTTTSTTTTTTTTDHDHDGHDHDDDEDAEDPRFAALEAGTRGGHLFPLSNGKKTEIQYDADAQLFSLYIDGLGDVSGATISVTSGGEEKSWDLERSDTPAGPVWGILDEDLAAALAADDAAGTVTIKTAEGDITTEYPPVAEGESEETEEEVAEEEETIAE